MESSTLSVSAAEPKCLLCLSSIEMTPEMLLEVCVVMVLCLIHTIDRNRLREAVPLPTFRRGLPITHKSNQDLTSHTASRL